MNERSFEFSAQFALDRALAQRERRERELSTALRALEAHQRTLKALTDAHTAAAAAVQDARRTLAHHGPAGQPVPACAEVLEIARAQLQSLRQRERRQATILQTGQQALAVAESAVREARAAFEQASSAARMLEQVREARYREHRAARMQAQERDADDAALDAWRRGRIGG
ncbi:MAG: hypothetical protein NTV94_10350 [Planctomycetota bacterium]|nr:hypothetical protein [Planctomycetota bacterium]